LWLGDNGIGRHSLKPLSTGETCAASFVIRRRTHIAFRLKSDTAISGLSVLLFFILIRVKRPQSPSSPTNEKIGWPFFLAFIVLLLKPYSEFEERAEQRGTIVVD